MVITHKSSLGFEKGSGGPFASSSASNERAPSQFPAKPLLISALQRAVNLGGDVRTSALGVFVVHPAAQSDAPKFSPGTNFVHAGWTA
jgi:hypothetical protein